MELHISPKARPRDLQNPQRHAALKPQDLSGGRNRLKEGCSLQEISEKCCPQARFSGSRCGPISSEGCQGSSRGPQECHGNAEYKGLESENLKIYHAGTLKGRTIRGWMPRAMGRATPKNTETVSVEMVLTEVKS